MKGWILTWASVAIAGSIAVAATATFASPSHSQAPATTPASSKAVVSGFTVDIVDARANPFDVEVDLNVVDGPVGGGLVFAPGPRLMSAGGISLDLVSGRTNGNSMTLRFDRPSGLKLEPGDELSLEMVSLVSRTGGFVGNQPMPSAHILALTTLSSAVNPTQMPMATSAALGPAAARVDLIATAPNQFRVSGHLIGFSGEEIAATTLSRTRLLTSDGSEVAPVVVRTGFGGNRDSFESIFNRDVADVDQLHIALQVDSRNPITAQALPRLLPYLDMPAIMVIPLKNR